MAFGLNSLWKLLYGAFVKMIIIWIEVKFGVDTAFLRFDEETNQPCVCENNQPIDCTYPCSSDKDTWAEIAKHLDIQSLLTLAAIDKWFHRAIMNDDNIWKLVCLRDLCVPTSPGVAYKWRKIYRSAFVHDYCYMFHDQDIEHFGGRRIGAFSFDSSEAILPHRLDSPGNILSSQGYCELQNVKLGIWILDQHAVECYLCGNDLCTEMMHTLDARHIELFLHEEYLNGSWEYELEGEYVQNGTNMSVGAIIDLKHLEDSSTAELFGDREWNFPYNTLIVPHAVAVCTTVAEENRGFQVNYYAMREGTNGEVVSIRISQFFQ